MKKLCFGTFATILKICSAKRISQKLPKNEKERRKRRSFCFKA